MYAITAGQTAPKFFWRHNWPVRDGAAFTLLEDGQPFIAIYLNCMTEEEIEHISARPIESAYWSEGGFWLGILKIGRMMQELSFDPMIHVLNYQSFSPELFRENRIVTIVGIDSADMTVRALHAATYPWKFLRSLFEAFKGFCPQEGYSEAYGKIINEHDHLPLTALWGKFTPGGYFGEKRVKE
jgi:hypothetical protein